MPGYSQLKKLSETVLKLGNEIKLRAERGEKAVPVLIPDTIEDIDDSQDFVLGMPEKPEPEPEPEEEAADESAGQESEATSDVSVDDLLSGIASGADDLDLSAFGADSSDASKSKDKGSKAKKAAAPKKEKEPEPPPPPPKGISGSGYSGFGFDDDGVLEEASDEKKPDIAALMGGPGKKDASAFSGATGIPELDAILNPNKGAEKKTESAPPVPPVQSAPKPEAAPKPESSPLPKTPEPESAKPQEVDFGDLDELEVEEYSPPEKESASSKDVDAGAIFGDDVEEFEIPNSAKEKKKKPVFKPLPVEDDIAILKPDIFTDKPVSKENPPYYATGPFGKLPEQPPVQRPAVEEPKAKEESPTEDFSSLDGIEVEEMQGSEPPLEETPAEDSFAAEPVTEAEAEPLSEAGASDEADPLAGIDFNMDDLPPLEGEPLSGETAAEDSLAAEPVTEAEAAPLSEAGASDEGDPLAGIDFNMDDLPPLEGEPLSGETPAEDSFAAEPVTEAEAEPISEAGASDEADPLAGMDFNMDDIPPLEGEPLSGETAAEDSFAAEPVTEAEAEPISEAGASDEADPLAGMDFNMDDIPPLEGESATEEAAADESATAASDDLEFGSDAEFAGGPAIDLNMDLPEEISEVPPEVSALNNDGDAAPEMEAAPETDAASEESFDLPDMDMDAFGEENPLAESPASDEIGEAPLEESPAEEEPSAPSADAPDFGDFGLPDAGGEEISDAAVEAPKGDEDIFNTDGMDFASFDMPDSFGAEESAPQDGALPGESLGGADDATASALDGFDIQDTDSQLSKASDDFDLEGSGDDFSIPGFSEEGADPYANDGKKGGLDQVDFTGAVTGDGKQRTALTEEEYEKFKKNLHDYPLNVRIAVEDMIAKNEFTDEVVFEVIEKILKKVTARQLAGHLEKMLDISLPVPRDYERRSAEEYEAYKSSFAYQLKSRILPAIIIGIFAGMILFCLGYLGHRFVYKPLMAEKIYKEGYVLIQRDEFPLSKDKFDEALKYKSKKKWFFRYAQAYRAKKQYDLSELFYKNILKRFNHDKQAGLEYAQMEVEDLANYELAEEILKREVLDNHVNDPDGILALGDTYLEWASERDPAKFEDAYQTYSKLQQLYGSKNPNLYQSRFLRYNIRTDQLRNVLELKEYFFVQGEKSLGAADWTELSGYLLDKQYEPLPADQEFLRDKIEDVRDMMLFAVKAAPEDPIANYNLSRYFVHVGDHNKALQSLSFTEKLFDKATNLRKRSIYKQLNNYRLLGEEYLYDREYLLARKTFNDGLKLFESKKRQSNFDSDKNIGVMYSDMGNLDYFISGDLDAARMNYQNSIDNKNDTPSIRYRVGYIDYSNEDYQNALNNFIKASQQISEDSHLMLALGNTLSLKDDNYAAQGYYDRLLERLDLVREKYGIDSPQTDERAGDMVETYMKASNNLGVSLFRIARQSGSSSKNAASLVNFQNSIRYYDAMTRNQETMVRLPGSNLAEMNLRYATNPFPKFEPEIYTDIPRVLDGEKGLEQ
ncbi:MAG: hypothetical protein K6A42_11675 [Treponema sp.]|nr:hypothetical protein [Treponema sp.]